MKKFVSFLLMAVLIAFMAIEYQYLQNTSLDPGPFPLMIANFAVAALLRHIANILTKPSHIALEDAMGMWKSEVQYACIKAGIAELITSKGPSTVEQLSQYIGARSSEDLQRLLRTAESLGYFYEDTKTGKWHHSRLSEVLHPAHPLSVSSIISHWKEDTQTAWSHFYESIMFDENVFENTHDGNNYWEYLQANPVQEKQFQRGMANQDALSTHAVTFDYPHWDKFLRIVDYGGGHGGLLVNILHKTSDSATPPAGILFDQPQVMDIAINTWKSNSKSKALLDRVSMVGGSFFDVVSLPMFQPHDAILLRTVLHDWSDSECIQILRNLRERIGTTKDVTVMLAEIVLEEKDPMSIKYFIDLHMKVVFHHAKERYLHQWQSIIGESGFILVNVHKIRAISSILELRPK